MWEKMVGKRQGIILECSGRLPHGMVKGVVTCVKANLSKTALPRQRNARSAASNLVLLLSIPSANQKCFASNMPIQSTRKDVSSALKIMLKLVGVFVEVVLEEKESEGGIKMYSL